MLVCNPATGRWIAHGAVRIARAISEPADIG
jgi:hypothetical protein